MNAFAYHLTDLDVVLHCDAYQCHICKSEPGVLYRLRLQEWPTEPYSLEEDERFVIRRRLVCDHCLRQFVRADNAVGRFAAIVGKTWCLRERADERAATYTRERWLGYLDQVRRSRLK